MADQSIRLNPEFHLMYDGKNCWLVRPRISKNGKEYMSEPYCGYKSTFEDLLESFVKMRLPEKDSRTVKSALQNLASVQNEVIALAREIGQGLDRKAKEDKKNGRR